MARKAAKQPARPPFAGWQAFGLPAFAAALTPWQDKLTSAELIPAYYQREISIVAGVIGVLACFAIWRLGRRLKRRTLARFCLTSLAAFIAAVAACLWLDATVDVTFFPEGGTVVLLQWGWQLLYIAVFTAFSATIATALLLK